MKTQHRRTPHAITITLSLVALLPLSLPATAQWVETLPPELQDTILWVGDHEEGSLYDWDKDGDNNLAGGCVCNTGGDEVLATVTSRIAHSGQFAARTSISNAYRAENGSRAVRLMRWTDAFWDEGGEHFPDSAYYSAWFYFPQSYNTNKYEPWDPGDGGWWNVFQFKSEDEQCDSQPMFTLNIAHDDDQNFMYFYLYSKENTPNSYPQSGAPRPIPVREWVHIEAFYVNSPTLDGRITIWQDGVEVLDVPNVVTSLDGCEDKVIWGIGNYTDHIAGGAVEGTGHIVFDDAVVSTERISTLFGALASTE